MGEGLQGGREWGANGHRFLDLLQQVGTGASCLKPDWKTLLNTLKKQLAETSTSFLPPPNSNESKLLIKHENSKIFHGPFSKLVIFYVSFPTAVSML